MKNATTIIALGLSCMFVSCASDKAVDAEEIPVVKEVEVVRVETSVPDNTTEITFGKDGASVKTKDGDSGTKIEVNGSSAKVEVKGE